jgi:2-keto-4-pentenoate hydratase/2-oxohepta-3-ene-1,7-dioic acid hydratase in catechol pathway
MKLVTYESTDAARRAGMLVEETVVDAEACARAASLDGSLAWTSVKSIIARARPAELDALAAAARDLAATAGRPIGELRLHAPIPDPEKVLCIALNYRDHVDEAQRDVDATLGTQPDPVVFSKFSSALIGHGQHIVLPPAAPSMIDWEGELAVVIGRTCARVSAADALDYVAGYTVLNDVSARDLQLASPQWLMGKSFDTSAPCGPALVTRDEVPEPQALRLTTTVNGEVMQRTSTALMINPIGRLIEYISALITLVPGDIIATGTPAGVGFARDPKVFLGDGDEVTVAVEGIGQLTSPVRAAA